MIYTSKKFIVRKINRIKKNSYIRCRGLGTQQAKKISRKNYSLKNTKC